MNRVAVLAAASFAMLLVACAPDRSMPDSSRHSSGEVAEPQVATGRTPAGEVERPVVDATSSAPPRLVNEQQSGVNAPAEVRDAKEAAEEAARKIFDATAVAAARIRDAGRDAVQAVRDSTSRKSETEAESADELGANSPDQPQSKPVGS